VFFGRVGLSRHNLNLETTTMTDDKIALRELLEKGSSLFGLPVSMATGLFLVVDQVRSLADPRFSSGSAVRLSQHGIRGWDGTI
jgi:hypothetical protein